MSAALGYAALSATSPLAPHSFQRREPLADDVQIEILYCGICHSDLHTARNEWGGTVYPVVPGHEIVGRVTAVGSGVSRFKLGQMVGVGCLVDSCQHCDECAQGEEQFCNAGIQTYNSPDKHSGARTLGGYSNRIVVDQRFVLRIPEGVDPAATAPLLCAGITTYSPLRHWRVGPGMTVGIVGLGGLGHVALRIAKALGAKVVLFTTSPGKEADARRLGADEVVISKDKAQMARHQGKLDLILDTVAAAHDLDALLKQLRRDGTLVLVGAPDRPHPSPNVFNLIARRRRIAGSLIGGIRETQEMLDFCARHGIVADIEKIAIQDINEAYERMLRSDVKYRFVIDMATLA